MNKESDFAAYWNSKKEYIQGDLWVIRNFLSKEDLEYLEPIARDYSGWYTTMRSPYGGNIKNKFLEVVPEYDANGEIVLPHEKSEFIRIPLIGDEGGINQRCTVVLPKHYTGCGAFQSIFEVPLDQTPKDAIDDDYAMNWHYEEHDIDDLPESAPRRTASFLIYINDDFDGGEVHFMNFPHIKIKPEPGMLINIPMTKEFTHKVTRVYNGNRHALYGSCWDRTNDVPLSTKEDC